MHLLCHANAATALDILLPLSQALAFSCQYIELPNAPRLPIPKAHFLRRLLRLHLTTSVFPLPRSRTSAPTLHQYLSSRNLWARERARPALSSNQKEGHLYLDPSLHSENGPICRPLLEELVLLRPPVFRKVRWVRLDLTALGRGPPFSRNLGHQVHRGLIRETIPDLDNTRL